MKAAIYRGIEDIEIIETPKPSCDKDGLIIRVEACGICGSDIRTYYKGTSYVKPNTIIGHEVVGVVEEIGTDQNQYKIGDRLAIAPIIPCGYCHYCRRGLQFLCENEEDFGGSLPGGFAEYMHITGKAIRLGSVGLVPDHLNDVAATLAEPLSSVVKAHEMVNTRLGDSVVVIGAGPVGCMHVQIARMRGASLIIQTEKTKQRIENAKKFEADLVIDINSQDPLQIIKNETNGRGADLVICAAPSTVVAAQAVQMVNRGGTVLWFGGLPSGKDIVEVSGNLVHYNDINIRGTIGFSPRHFHQSLGLIAKDAIKSEMYISGTLPLDKLVEGIEKIQKGDAMKLVIQPQT